MIDTPKETNNNLINELDSLRATLNSGPEFQQTIPTLDEPIGYDGIMMSDLDLALDIPILTDELVEVTCSDSQDSNITAVNEPHIDLDKMNAETALSAIELERVLDELIAEQLPKLELKLREKLHRELKCDVDTRPNDSLTENLETGPSTK